MSASPADLASIPKRIEPSRLRRECRPETLGFRSTEELPAFDGLVGQSRALEALHDAVRAGKVLYLGGSSMFAWQFAELQLTAKLNGFTPFVSMQNHYNLIYREEEREMIPLCLAEGVGLVPYSPLARGFVIGNLDTHDHACRALATQADCLVVAVDYRLAPEHQWPSGGEDVASAATWLAPTSASA